jgi:hypothetical protein
MKLFTQPAHKSEKVETDPPIPAARPREYAGAPDPSTARRCPRRRRPVEHPDLHTFRTATVEISRTSAETAAARLVFCDLRNPSFLVGTRGSVLCHDRVGYRIMR